MSVDYTRSEGETPKDSEPMFAPTPMWDRSKKNRAKSRAERRSFFDRDDSAEAFDAPATGAAAASAPLFERESVRETRPADAAVAADEPPYVAPAGRTVVRRDRSVAPAAVVGGLVALAALAAAGWYATRPADKTLTPGGPGAPATSIASGPAVGGADQVAANTPSATAAQQAATTSAGATTTTTTRHVTSAAATPTTTRRSTTTTVTTRTRPAANATTSGVDTATTAPTSAGAVTSMPQTAAPPPAAVAPATPAPPPVTVAPTPAPAPAPTTQPAPTTTPDVAPSTSPSTTPPQ